MGKLKSFRNFGLALLALGLASPSFGAHPPPPAGAERTAAWNTETSDLEPDDRILYGRLANGLRYAIRRNERPQNRVLVRLAFDFGSAAETDDEQGLAHFIEHMTFNGTTNVPEGEMVRMLERLGLRFGADTNASTGYTMTDYRLDLPKADLALIERALFLMRETASEVLFDPHAVDRERGVVLAEMRQRENFNFQRARALNDLFYPDSYFSTRYAIGKKEILETASADTIRALYRKWYTPDRARIVVVGPVDPAAIEREIVGKFASWKGSSKALGDIDQCRFNDAQATDARIFAHPEVSEAINVEQIVADGPRPDTVDRSLLSLKMSIASAIVADRLARKSRAEDSPYLGSSITATVGFCDRHARIGFTVASKDGGWKLALPMVEQQLRQAVAFGFSAQEVDEQLRRLDAAYANEVAAEATAPSASFANELTRLDKDVVNGAAYRQRMWLQLKPFLTPQAIHAEYARWLGQLDRPQIFLSTRNGEGISRQALLDAYAESRKVAVAPPVTREDQAWAYSDFGVPGKIVDDSRIDDLDIRTIRFENGVLLNMKRTDFEANRVRWSLRIDGGELLFGKQNPELALLMNGAFVGGGLGRHQIDDLRALLAGSTASPAMGAADDYFGGAGAVVTEDLGRQLELLAAYITDPGYREEALRLFRRPLPEFYARLQATPDSVLSLEAPRIMTGNDPRFVLPPLETVQAVDFARLRPVLTGALATNRLEIGLVGDFDQDMAATLVARTFGALPTRSGESGIGDASRKAAISGEPGTYDLSHRGEPNQLGWQRAWPTTDDSDFRLEQTMDLLARAAQIRLIDELREKLGATYGASASSSMSDVYAGFGTFAVSTSGDPKDLTAIEAAVDAVIAEFVSQPMERDLFERARKPVLETYADWKKRNGTWAGIVASAQSKPERTERFRINEEQFRSITREDVWTAARRFLQNKPGFTFRALPKAPATTGG